MAKTNSTDINNQIMGAEIKEGMKLKGFGKVVEIWLQPPFMHIKYLRGNNTTPLEYTFNTGELVEVLS